MVAAGPGTVAAQVDSEDGVVVAEDRVLVDIRLPDAAREDVMVSFGEHSRFLRLDRSGTGQVALPVSEEGTLEVQVRNGRYGSGNRGWVTICSFPSYLVSPGVVEITYSSLGLGGRMKQWPVVVLWMDQARPSGPLDLSLNGSIRGTAGTVGANQLKMAVRPDQEHRLEWRAIDGAEVCSTTIKLPANVRRTYICEPTEGKIQIR